MIGKSFAAGFLIGLSCVMYLSVEPKAVAGLLFSMGLLSICTLKLNLFTGLVGWYKRGTGEVLSAVLLWNIVGAAACAFLAGFTNPDLIDLSRNVISVKLAQTPLSSFIRAFFCGVLMYLAVVITKKTGNVIAILIAVPFFLLAGFEHSIADAFYFYLAADLSFLPRLALIILGNATGSITIHQLTKEEKKA